MTIILGSSSPIRHELLSRAGIDHRVSPSNVDERAVAAAVQDVDPQDLSQILADVKAVTVSAAEPGALIIGADQVLLLDGAPKQKCHTMKEARIMLLALSGRCHQLSTAASLARDGEILWRHQTLASLILRPLSAGQIGRYLAAVGDSVLGSVGCYQLEGHGVRLMQEVRGDYFSILGLPLLPLLHAIARYDCQNRWDSVAENNGE